MISYADDADAVLVTARRTADSPESDQVIVLCRPPGLELEQVGEWNALGVPGNLQHRVRAAGDRGRRSRPGRSLRRHLDADHAPDGPPAVVVGVAGHRLRRRGPGPQVRAGRGPPQARHPAGRRLRLAEVTVVHQQFVDMVQSSLARYEAADSDATGWRRSGSASA